MSQARYPLEPLHEVRSAAVEARQRGLAEAVAAREAADLARAQAESRLEEERVRAERLVEQERFRVEAGLSAIGDLRRLADWRVGARAREGALSEALERAVGLQREARAREEEARAALAAAQAAAEAVTRHRTAFHEEHRRHAELQGEEAALEAWSAGRGR